MNTKVLSQSTSSQFEETMFYFNVLFHSTLRVLLLLSLLMWKLRDREVEGTVGAEFVTIA